MSINRVVISGNLTRDPELRSTQGGTAVLGMGVAVNERVKDRQTGEWTDRPNYVDVSVFGNRAEPLSRILAKGMRVVVEGRLRYSSWTGKDGAKRSKLDVVADEVELPPRPRQDGGGRQAGGYGQPAQQPCAAAVPPRPAAPVQRPATMGQAYQAVADFQARQAKVPSQQPQLYDEDIPF